MLCPMTDLRYHGSNATAEHLEKLHCQNIFWKNNASRRYFSEHFRFTRKAATEQIQNFCHGGPPLILMYSSAKMLLKHFKM